MGVINLFDLSSDCNTAKSNFAWSICCIIASFDFFSSWIIRSASACSFLSGIRSISSQGTTLFGHMRLGSPFVSVLLIYIKKNNVSTCQVTFNLKKQSYRHVGHLAVESLAIESRICCSIQLCIN